MNKELCLYILSIFSTFIFQHIPQIDKTGIAFGPTIEPPHEGAVFTESSFDAFKAGRFNRVPLIMGLTSLETAIFSDCKF